MPGDGNGLESGIFIDPSERDAQRSAVKGAREKRLKRFYRLAAAAPAPGGFTVLLDGKQLRTPARGALIAPTLALAQALAAEWARQGEFVEPQAMPLMRLANTAIDGVAPRICEVEADALKYAASDLICYRAEGPEPLCRAQAEAWDPLVRFARDACGARLVLSEGVTFQPQAPEALAAVARGVREHVGDDAGAAFRLTALHTMTTLTGSLIIALAVAERAIGADAGFAAAHVDEDYQMRVWGADSEAMARRELRLAEMRAAAEFSALAG